MKYLTAIMLLFCTVFTLFTSDFVLSINARAFAATIFVPKEHKTIQAALNAAKAGDTVLVSPGTYQEELHLKSNVTLKGDKTQAPVLTKTVMAVNVKNAIIEGFTVRGGTKNSHFGIVCQSSQVTIRDNTVSEFHHGISADLSAVQIVHNTIEHSFNVGIIVTIGKDMLIQENHIINNEGWGIIMSELLGECLIIGNTIENNQNIGIQCLNASPSIRENLIRYNLVGLSINKSNPDIGTTADAGRNVIEGNRNAAVENLGRDAVSAKLNYWGNPDGPEPRQIQGRVEYTPWLRQPPQMDSHPVNFRADFITTWGDIKIGRYHYENHK